MKDVAMARTQHAGGELFPGAEWVHIAQLGQRGLG